MGIRSGSAMGHGRWRAQFVSAAIAAALVGLAVAARADDMWLSSGFDVFALVFAAAALLLFPLYVLLTIFIEAWVLKAMLAMTWNEGLKWSFLANIASGLVSGIWYVVGMFEGGWKTAMMKGDFGRALLLMLRSYLVTLAVETFVLVFALNKKYDAPLILKVTAAANAASYVIGFIILAAIAPHGVQRAVTR